MHRGNLRVKQRLLIRNWTCSDPILAAHADTRLHIHPSHKRRSASGEWWKVYFTPRAVAHFSCLQIATAMGAYIC